MMDWSFISGTSHLIGACAAATLGVYVLGKRKRSSATRFPTAVALAMSASWALAAAATSTDSAATALAEAFRNIGWLFLVYRLFVGDGRFAVVRPVRPVLLALGGVEVVQAILQLEIHRLPPGALDEGSVFSIVTAFRQMLAIGGLVLLHNLYGGASQISRRALRWPALAMALMWLYDLNLFTVSYLSGAWPVELAALRGLVLVLMVGLLIPTTMKRRDELHINPSRIVTFQFVSLAGIGLYLVGMAMLAHWLSYVGGHYSRFLQFGFLIAASVLALIALPSRRMRGWLKVTLVKHLFQHRYDYRLEWLRFAGTIGRTGDTSRPLEERAVQAVAQITESEAGMLLVPGENGSMVLAGRWQWPVSEVPAEALNGEAVSFFERGGYIVELDAVRRGEDRRGELAIVPDWLREETRAWALVPLLHHDRLVGVVVLARPRADRMLDWEDFDLFRVIGQQLATTLAEHAGQDALAEAARFDEFNRRIAFVMHDIKNLASQLGLLARNAEHHAENPAFRADMLVTLRNSSDKLNALIARLSRYGAGGNEAPSPFDIGELLSDVARQFAGRHDVFVSERQGGEVTANRDALEQALVHIVQNAIDASPAGSPVFLSQTTDGLYARLEVVDSGHGMSPEFVRSKLFKPFVSSKQGGFGIGAFESRELIRGMRGRLDVESREGLGTRFIIRIPLSATADMLSALDRQEPKVA